MTDPWIGKTLGRYFIESELGRGGMGVVYLGRQLSLNRHVAIKVLPVQLAMDAQFRQRFQQEAQVIAALVHENIVHVYDVEEAEGATFIVMERISGQSLRQLRESRRLTVEEVCSIGSAVARALGVAHARGIVHRDVKSQNVMVTDDGKVKLMDFGIARVAGTGIKTQTGSVLGTPEYMAPEQAREGKSSPQTDLYSLGILLYELATGRLPFTGGDPFAVALKQITEAPTPPRSIDPQLPEWLEWIVLKAMAKDPAERFTSAAEIEQALASRGGTKAAESLPPTPGIAVPGVLGAHAPGAPADRHSGQVLAPATAPTRTVGQGDTYAPLTRPSGRRLGWAAAVLLALVAASWLGYRLLSPPPPPGVISSNTTGGSANLLPPSAEGELNDPVTSPPTASKTPTVIPEAVVPPPASTFGPSPSSPPAAAPAVVSASAPGPAAAVPEPMSTAPPEPVEPAWTPIAPIVETFRCREAVEFHVDPEKARVIVDGQVLGVADDWDGIGRKARQWKPGPGRYVACFTAKGLPSACARIVVGPHEDDDECDVDVALEDFEDDE